MELFLSKKEIENLNEEYKSLNILYTNKERVITQMFATKVYNLMKKDYDLASNYIDTVLNISSICEDVNLTYYSIEDSKILLTIENNILSGFILEKKRKNISSFFNTVKIRNDFIIAIPEKTSKPVILENLLTESNIKCLNFECSTISLEINKKIKENLDDILKHNMYIEYQFRKDEFMNTPLKKDEKNLLIMHYIKEKKLRTEPNVEKYIYDMFEDKILNYSNEYITNLTTNLKTSMSKKILDVDYIYNQITQNLNVSIIKLLNKPIFESVSRNKSLIVLDWIFIRDDIFDFIKKKNYEAQLKRFLRYILVKQNMIYIDIYNDIKSKCENYDTFNVSYQYSVERTCKNNFNKIMNKGVTINKLSFRCTFIGFIDVNDNFFALDDTFKIDDILSLTITHGDTLLYSVPEETKDLLISINNKLISTLNDNEYIPIDHCKLKRVEDIKIY